MRIQTNTAANSALGYMRTNNAATERSIQKLSSGFRINRSADDAAGLAIANKLRSDIKGLGQAQRNVAQGTSMLQVMDGATQTVSTIVDRMKELATQANSANVGTQSDKLQGEFKQLRSEIDRIVSTTNYQGTKLVDGSFGKGAGDIDVDASAGDFAEDAMSADATIESVTVTDKGLFSGKVTFEATAAVEADAAADPPVVAKSATLTATLTRADGTTVEQTVDTEDGAATLAFDKLGFTMKTGSEFVADDGLADDSELAQKDAGTGSFQVSSSGAYALGEGDQVQVTSVDLRSTSLGLAESDISTQKGAAEALTKLDAATNTINSALGNIGAAQSRFDFASANVATTLQNTQAAESTIRDADMAEEMTKFTKNNILQQAAQSMLSQANQGTQGILQLLRG
jgi:flagellin